MALPPESSAQWAKRYYWQRKLSVPNQFFPSGFCPVYEAVSREVVNLVKENGSEVAVGLHSVRGLKIKFTLFLVCWVSNSCKCQGRHEGLRSR